MVRPKQTEGGKRRLMVTEEAYKIFQDIAALAELSGAGAAADRLALRYGELMRKEYETLNTPYNPAANPVVSRSFDNSKQVIPFERRELDSERPQVRQPTAQTNPLTAALGIF